MPPVTDPNVLVGIATSDDAGVYRLSDDVALVQTVDFFTPIVDDPYDFGRIAAANSLSDIYAMGATPLTALNICAFPVDDLDHDILARILLGGAEIARAAGVAILGGHTVKDAEPKYGMAVTGTVHPDRVVTNAGARPGDLLLLTKPIGTGILSTALKRGTIAAAAMARAVVQMIRLNDLAAKAMVAHGAHAATDVTGFGLLGHAGEMARASRVALTIEANAVLTYERVLDLIAEGVVPGGTRDNAREHAAFTTFEATVDEPHRILLSDATTSGGLLIAADPADAPHILRDLEALETVRVIGFVSAGPAGTIVVR
ncbi:MAG: selenide, water dikinase SelD [Candidatus Velthaea sp.]